MRCWPRRRRHAEEFSGEPRFRGWGILRALPRSVRVFDDRAADGTGHLHGLSAYARDLGRERSRQLSRANAHFGNLKDWISRAYYSSPVGMQALGYTGAPGGVFEGCK